MAGERQMVRLAVAAYFGGTLVGDGEVKYQGGPLSAYGLGTAYPYSVKHGPDTDYAAGQPAGQNWGAVMSTTRVRRADARDSYGGGTSGWRAHQFTIACRIGVICELDHIEIAGAGLDDLIDAMRALMYADRTLGTTGGAYAGLPGGRLLIEAGETRTGVTDETDEFVGLDSAKGRYAGEATVTFNALTMVEG